MIYDIKKQIDCLIKLTDKVGIIEHSIFDKPNYLDGYCVDDNARALQVCLRFKEKYPILENVLSVYLNFLKSALKEDHLYADMNSDGDWQEKFEINGEHYGRTLTALGEVGADKLFDQIYSFLTKEPCRHVRVFAHIILGLQYRYPERIRFWADLMIEQYLREKNDFIFGDKKNSENLFIERWYQLLKPNGRFGVVLPESIFDTTENKYIRLFIYKYFKVKAVISLPQLTFEPFTNTKTSLLFSQKKTETEIDEWNKFWGKYSNEWSNLKTRCENLLSVYLDGKDRKKLPSIKDLNEIEEKEILIRILKDYIEEDDKKLSPKELAKKYKDEVGELCKYDNETKNTFGFVNTWWVFGEVAKELNYKIFMAEVENVGYKRTKRGEKPMPNELYRVNEKGEVLVDDGIKKTALDYLREIQWD